MTLVLIIFLFILNGAVASPFGALIGYIWFALFRPQEWVWVDISGLRLSLVLGLILVVRSAMAKSWPNLKHPISIGMLAFLFTGLVAQSNAANPELGWQWLDYFSRLTCMTLLLITLVDSQRRFYYIILTICTTIGYFTAKAGLASMIGGGVRFSDGLAGAFVDNNGYALAGVMVLPLFVAVASQVPPDWSSRKQVSLAFYAAVPLTAFAVVCTFSRGGLLALIAAVVSFTVFQQRKITITVLLLVTLGVASLFVPMPEGYTARVESITSYEEKGETSAMSRLHFWAVAWDMAKQNPLGVGMFNFGPTYDRYDFSDGKYGHNRVAHSSHFQVLAENGFLGFAVWVWLYFKSFKICFHIRRAARQGAYDEESSKFYESMATALMVSMFAFLVGSSFIALALNDLTWITFGLVAALDRLSYSGALKSSNGLIAGELVHISTNASDTAFS